MSGVIHGTVKSGHPTQTTWGNTIRISGLVEVMKKRSHIPDHEFEYLVSGDDTLVITSKWNVSRYEKEIWKLCVKGQEKQAYGVGYQIKCINKSPDIIDFLSKTGLFNFEHTFIMRQA